MNKDHAALKWIRQKISQSLEGNWTSSAHSPHLRTREVHVGCPASTIASIRPRKYNATLKFQVLTP